MYYIYHLKYLNTINTIECFFFFFLEIIINILFDYCKHLPFFEVWQNYISSKHVSSFPSIILAEVI